ncbi:fatty acid synthase-like [Aplysia californica]|uniref:Fatty acid synthase-like n=1 Tax=Aplysia californica TaxID=6500 RepID=A0ABM1VQ99_APLCA|nr:fatty acid synthase-like [Aplysia californica]
MVYISRSYDAEPREPHMASEKPRLFTFSARSEEGVREVLKEVRKNAKSVEFQALIQDSANMPTNQVPFRGYTIINGTSEVEEINRCSPDRRPVWFIFAGIGSQWQGMGRKMMELAKFRETIDRLSTVLRQHDVDLHDLIMNDSGTKYGEVLTAYVGIVSIQTNTTPKCPSYFQIALVDLLHTLHIFPDGLVGHSVGEFGCAYADGSLTAEETVQVAYWRGRCLQEAKLPRGKMVAIGLSWDECNELCPEGVVVACHNSAESVTIAGAYDAVTKFAEELKAKGVFVRDVNSSNMAYHSPFMNEVAPVLKAKLEQVITPKKRSPKWVSTSVPEARWGEELAQYSSAEYHVNNLVSAVLFQEGLQKVPSNAIAIEIAPHCLLQAILKRSLSTEATFVGLMKRFHENNIEFFFNSLGKCFANGMDLNPMKVYPPVQYPVPRGTPNVSTCISKIWDHSVTWSAPHGEDFPTSGGGASSGAVFEIDVSEESPDHYIVRPVTLTVDLIQGTDQFNICENDTLVVDGNIYCPEGQFLDRDLYKNVREYSSHEETTDFQLTREEIYRELRLRGYEYGPAFEGISSCSETGLTGELKWDGRWITFTDAMLQTQILSRTGTGLFLPTRIQSLKIDPRSQPGAPGEGKHIDIPVCTDQVLDLTFSGGVELHGLHVTAAPFRGSQAAPVLEKCLFHPYLQDDVVACTELTAYVERYVKPALDNLKLSNCECATRSGCRKSSLNKEPMDCITEDSTTQQNSNTQSDSLPSSAFTELLTLLMDMNSDENILQHFHTEHVLEELRTGMESVENLKPCIDIVLENVSSSSPVSVLEVGAAKSTLYRKIVPSITNCPTFSVNYTGADKNPLPADAKTFDVKFSQWDPSTSKSVPPGQVQLLVLKNVLHKQPDIDSMLETVSTMVVPEGFILVEEVTKNVPLYVALETISDKLSNNNVQDVCRACDSFLTESSWVEVFTKHNYDVICRKSDNLLSTLFLLRKKAVIPLSPTLIFINEITDFSWVDSLKSKMKTLDTSQANSRLWIIAAVEDISGITGLIKSLRKEPSGGKVRCALISNTKQSSPRPILTVESVGFQNLIEKDLVINVYRDGHWGSFRNLPLTEGGAASEKQCEFAYVDIQTRGDLSSFRWIESPLKYFQPDGSDTELCSVYYTSLNFRDVMLATGKLPPDAIPGHIASQDCILGLEFSGRDSKGSRIMGILPAKVKTIVV